MRAAAAAASLATLALLAGHPHPTAAAHSAPLSSLDTPTYPTTPCRSLHAFGTALAAATATPAATPPPRLQVSLGTNPSLPPVLHIALWWDLPSVHPSLGCAGATPPPPPPPPPPHDTHPGAATPADLALYARVRATRYSVTPAFCDGRQPLPAGAAPPIVPAALGSAFLSHIAAAPTAQLGSSAHRECSAVLQGMGLAVSFDVPVADLPGGLLCAEAQGGGSAATAPQLRGFDNAATAAFPFHPSWACSARVQVAGGSANLTLRRAAQPAAVPGAASASASLAAPAGCCPGEVEVVLRAAASPAAWLREFLRSFLAYTLVACLAFACIPQASCELPASWWLLCPCGTPPAEGGDGTGKAGQQQQQQQQQEVGVGVAGQQPLQLLPVCANAGGAALLACAYASAAQHRALQVRGVVVPGALPLSNQDVFFLLQVGALSANAALLLARSLGASLRTALLRLGYLMWGTLLGILFAAACPAGSPSVVLLKVLPLCAFVLAYTVRPLAACLRKAALLCGFAPAKAKAGGMRPHSAKAASDDGAYLRDSLLEHGAVGAGVVVPAATCATSPKGGGGGGGGGGGWATPRRRTAGGMGSAGVGAWGGSAACQQGMHPAAVSPPQGCGEDYPMPTNASPLS